MKRLFLQTKIIILSCAGILSAQGDQELTIEPGVQETWQVEWYAEMGMTYFLQHSRDLAVWRNFPLIEIGQDDAVEWGFTVEEDPLILQPEPFFLRLKYTSLTFGSVELDDTDGDGIANWVEVFLLGYDPLSDDTDGDSILDNLEDEDSDGIYDMNEVLWSFGTLMEGDFDGDNLSDSEELVLGTDPNNADTDGDGLNDDVDELPLIHSADHGNLLETGSPAILEILSPEVTPL